MLLSPKAWVSALAHMQLQTLYEIVLVSLNIPLIYLHEYTILPP